jgi:hypothetical protein
MALTASQVWTSITDPYAAVLLNGIMPRLTAKEVGQFGFAAHAVGQDVQIFERMMRGLTMAIEDDSAKGEQARGRLRRFGVDMAEVRNGTASTSEVLQQIAEGLDKLPTTWERNTAALDIFKKSGIEAIPVLLELKRTFKEGLVVEVKWVGNAAKWLWNHLPVESVGGDIPTVCFARWSTSQALRFRIERSPVTEQETTSNWYVTSDATGRTCAPTLAKCHRISVRLRKACPKMPATYLRHENLLGCE